MLGRLGYGLWGGLVIGAACFLALPIVALLWRSLSAGLWQDGLGEPLWQALRLTLQTTAYSMGLVLLFGTPLAYALAHGRFWGRRGLNLLVELPIVMPPAVAGLGLLLAFGRRGLVGSYLFEWFEVRIAFTQVAVILAQTFVAMPFYVRSAQLGFASVDAEIESAALVDGASPVGRFLYVTFPLARRALLAGLLMSWARALGEFGATILFAGSLPGRTQTMTLLIYTIFEQDIQAATWAALWLIGLAAVVIVLTQWLVKASD
jgi:molybdate transport system permease protein